MATENVEGTQVRYIASLLKKIKQLPGNNQCADCQECICPQCSMKVDRERLLVGQTGELAKSVIPGHAQCKPHWLSEELQIIVCSECKAIHERVTEVSFRSLQTTADWSRESIQKIKKVSNNETNQIYENELPPAFRKPTRCFDWRFREHWIKSKYVKKYFKQRSNNPRYLWGDKRGYLWKRGRDDSLFMRRWFVLDVQTTPTLKYYADAEGDQIKGEIPLMSLDFCLTTEDKMGYPNAMQIFCTEGKAMDTRAIYLYSETAKELVEWYQAIRIRKFYELTRREPHKHLPLLLKGLGNDILHEGYLLKTGRKGTEKLRKRWFVLHGRQLHYFGEPLDANPKGTISLEGEGISVILSGQRDRSGFHFKLKTPDRVYPLIAEEEQHRDAWIKAIHQSCYQDVIELTSTIKKSATLPIRISSDVSELPGKSEVSPIVHHKTVPLPSAAPKITVESDSDSPQEELEEINLNYVYLQNGTVLANEEWDPEQGLMIKGEVLMLKIHPGALKFSAATTEEITVTVQKMDLSDISKSKEFGDVALMVRCDGSPPKPEVTIPLEMELYHCGVLADRDDVKPVLWHLEDSSWQQVASDDDRFSCEVLDHTFCIRSQLFGSLVASLEGENVIGKRMRCAAFCRFEENSHNLEIIVYILNNHVSNFVWKMIEVNETTNNNSTLMDISHEFRVLKENKALLLSIETMKGFQLMPGNFTSLKIPFEDIWCKTYASYHIELIQTAKIGECQLVLNQQLPVTGDQLATLNLKSSCDKEFGASPGRLQRHATPHPEHRSPATPHLVPPPIPSRGRSLEASATEGAKEVIEKVHFSSQRDSSAKDDETPAGESTLLPFSVKQELAKALDLAPMGKNWRAFAVEMGVNQTVCNSLASKVSPTMEVLKYCEYTDSTLDEVKEVLRYIANDEAVTVLVNYIKDL